MEVITSSELVWQSDTKYDGIHRVAANGVQRFEPSFRESSTNSVGLVSCTSMSLHRPAKDSDDWDQAAVASGDMKYQALQPPQTHIPGALKTFNAAAATKERPARLEDTLDELTDSGIASKCTAVSPTPATFEMLARAHGG